MKRERPSSKGLPSTRGTYFTSLEVRNIRCFSENQTLSLVGKDGVLPRWTIILGENGVGKTTLLQMFALASGEDHYHRYMFDRWEFEDGPGYPLEFSRSREDAGFIKAKLQVAGDAREVTCSVRDEFVHHESPPTEVDFLVCGYGAGRRNGSSRRSRHRRDSRFRFGSLFFDAPLQNAEDWLLGEDYAAAREGREGPAERRLERLKELLTRLLPEVADVRVGKARKRPYPSVDFKTPYGWVPLDALSLGYQSLVAWMVAVAAAMFDRYGKHANPLAEPAVVLVDEIDLHLHPRWQRDLLPYLTERFTNTQFIVTAHSPLVVQAAEAANVVLLRRDGDHVVIDDDPTDIRNWRIDQILTSDLYGLPTARPPHLDALITERRSILTKARLTAADKKRLRVIEAEIGELPAGETPDEQRATALILRAAMGFEPSTSKKKR